MIIHDGHIHSPYCPHGTKDSFESYIEEAIKKQLQVITFAEHAPLPRAFVDPTPLQDSAMSWIDFPKYVEQLQLLKEKYKGKLNILIGLEVDFIEGFEQETTEILQEVGPYLDDSILSVHFLKKEDKYDCLDYSPQAFGEMVKTYGTIDDVYRKYYETVKKSIVADLGPYKPTRIGHLTLVHKFQRKFPPKDVPKAQILELLDLIQDRGYMLDYNSAGLAKPLCLEPYPPEWVVSEAMKRNIPLIYGSDAHQAKEVLLGSNKLKNATPFAAIS